MAQRLRLRALHQVLDLERADVRERGGNNRGEAVERVIRYAQGVVGEPWCVNTVIWGYGRSGSKAIKPGYTRAVRFMVSNGVRPRRGRGYAGDPVRFIFDHVGLLIGYRRKVSGVWRACPASVATHILTVEGNTGPGNSLQSDSAGGGDGVYRKYRHLSMVRDFLYVPR